MRWIVDAMQFFARARVRRRIAILQIDEGHARRFQDRPPHRRARCNISRAWRPASSSASRCRHRARSRCSRAARETPATRAGSGIRNASCGKSSTSLRQILQRRPHRHPVIRLAACRWPTARSAAPCCRPCRSACGRHSCRPPHSGTSAGTAAPGADRPRSAILPRSPTARCKSGRMFANMNSSPRPCSPTTSNALAVERLALPLRRFQHVMPIWPRKRGLLRALVFGGSLLPAGPCRSGRWLRECSAFHPLGRIDGALQRIVISLERFFQSAQMRIGEAEIVIGPRETRIEADGLVIEDRGSPRRGRSRPAPWPANSTGSTSLRHAIDRGAQQVSMAVAGSPMSHCIAAQIVVAQRRVRTGGDDRGEHVRRARRSSSGSRRSGPD